jgi:hypothetical protein
MTDFFLNENFLQSLLNHSRPMVIANDNKKIENEEDKKEEEVTILDLFNIPFKNDEEIKKFILKRLKIDIDTQE